MSMLGMYDAHSASWVAQGRTQTYTIMKVRDDPRNWMFTNGAIIVRIAPPAESKSRQETAQSPAAALRRRESRAAGAWVCKRTKEQHV